MNVNCKLTLTDEQRNAMHNRLTGTATKKMVSRADVNEWVKNKLERFIKVGSPTTEEIDDSPAEPFFDDPDYAVEEIDYVNCDVKELVTQNKLLLTRVNRLQYMLDKS